jgi:aconitate hydratase
MSLDMADVVPSLAGPKRPQDRVPLVEMRSCFEGSLETIAPDADRDRRATLSLESGDAELGHGSTVIAALTSCTNTSNPAVMLGAGLVARKARERGLKAQPWVKTSLAPGSKVVTEYLQASGLLEDLEAVGFHLVGYGCTTCIGNSGPLPEPVRDAIVSEDLVVSSVLSGNRNFEGRVHALVKMNFLASPPLVVAYSLVGTVDVDLQKDVLGTDRDGQPVYLMDVWPTAEEIQAEVAKVESSMFRRSYDEVYAGDERWNAMSVPEGRTFDFSDSSTYIKEAPFFMDMGPEPAPVSDVTGARALLLLGDSVTTDHISPAGAFAPDTPAGRYLVERGVDPKDFNSYGSRRGNHEVMMRGTFANVRLRNQLAPGTEGGFTVLLPEGAPTTVFEASETYRERGTPLIVIAGKEYGTGSSRDWAAKGPRLLGVRAAIAESYERIHRSNLVGMGVLPLQFREGESATSLGLTGRESFDVAGLGDGSAKTVTVTATPGDGGAAITFEAVVRIDTPKEVEYYRHGGILNYVLRRVHARG